MDLPLLFLSIGKLIVNLRIDWIRGHGKVVGKGEGQIGKKSVSGNPKRLAKKLKVFEFVIQKNSMPNFKWNR